jgi:hypothetical protein
MSRSNNTVRDIQNLSARARTSAGPMKNKEEKREKRKYRQNLRRELEDIEENEGDDDVSSDNP